MSAEVIEQQTETATAEIRITYAVVFCVYTDDVGLKFESNRGRLYAKDELPECLNAGDVLRFSVEKIGEKHAA